ncbi:flagellar biosynthetic protein FlhB [Xylanibacillus composti]|uniref:Flagellar biosynthetic protein FlhB n=1 Tax=Xylanibacillus composti TaxID=1572762 RepID=A0A8J4H4C6_9BACL|nr:EscU/YscU/HrcU family type III secretion system export apparatus switch protein [Xylanibacillus composti]GIQ68664.1 flagellar biosynthetic protein FlhB [Xylanibacillus composti]
MNNRGQAKSSPAKGMRKAVALKYDPANQDAPTVAAKGKGLVADQIIEKAKEHQIPMHEDASLVEVLSKLDLDQAIPPELYQLVAEVLTFVYQSDQELKRREEGGSML